MSDMNIVCLDMEGVLVPEIWIAFAEESGIPELKKTTRDEPDYNKLMKYRLDILKEHGDIKAIFISHECDDYMIDELLAAVSELDVKPILISERYIDRAIDLFIGNDEEILKAKTHIASNDIESCKSTDDILKYLISHHCFGPDFEKPVLALFNCSNS